MSLFPFGPAERSVVVCLSGTSLLSPLRSHFLLFCFCIFFSVSVFLHLFRREGREKKICSCVALFVLLECVISGDRHVE